jgi:K+-transporting ATPase ATPase F chain
LGERPRPLSSLDIAGTNFASLPYGPAPICKVALKERSDPCSISRCWPPALRFLLSPWATPPPATVSEEAAMTLDYLLAALVTAGLLIYLTYALLRPERF